MGRAMIVSAGASSNEYLSSHLAELGYSRSVIVPSATEARRRMMDADFELIVVNSPLPDEFGHELCMDAVEKTDAGVVFLAKAAAAEQLMQAVSSHGILLLSKPFSSAFFVQVVRMAAASNHRLLRLREENARLQEKLLQLRLISRAKCCLVEREKITEAQAHRRIEKLAMDTRRGSEEVAQEIIEQYEEDAEG